jgi:carboxyl-terminal processing protease
VTGTYRITDAVRAVLDRSLAAGAMAWLFDLRGNVGGNGADVMASWFLDGQPTLRRVAHDGSPDLLTANRDLRLGPAYQLPIAVILNDRGGSSPEVFALSLRENKRATIVGGTSIGCLGGTKDAPLGSDGSYLFVAIHEYVGAVTGARYNNVGIPPDVAATDASAVATATQILLERLRTAP